MPGRLVFGLVLPGKDVSVVRRLLTVYVAEREIYSDFISPDLAELVIPDRFHGRHGDVVRTVLVDYDEAGNASPQTENTFVLQDVIPPPAPGDVVLKVLYEEPENVTVVSPVIPEPTIIAEEQPAVVEETPEPAAEEEEQPAVVEETPEPTAEETQEPLIIDDTPDEEQQE